MRVSASFQIVPLTAGRNVLGGEENCPGGRNVRGICPRGNVQGGKCPARYSLLFTELINYSRTYLVWTPRLPVVSAWRRLFHSAGTCLATWRPLASFTRDASSSATQNQLSAVSWLRDHESAYDDHGACHHLSATCQWRSSLAQSCARLMIKSVQSLNE